MSETTAVPGSRTAIVLAAGRGTRMRSSVAKVLHPVAGKPMIQWVVDAARGAGCCRLFVVIGHGGDEIQKALAGDDLVWIEQKEQLGTGHAVSCCAKSWAESAGGGGGAVLVLSGDAPLVRVSTLEALLREAEAGWGAVAVADLNDPGSLGRVVVNDDGSLARIVEVADATPDELSLRLVNSGHYALGARELFEHLDAIESSAAQAGPANSQGELYLTDAVVAAAAFGRPVRCLHLADASEAWGVNDRADLARVDRQLIRREVARLQGAGVTIVDPDRVRVEAGVEVEPDVTIHLDVTLQGRTSVGSGSVLHQGAWVRDCVLGREVEVLPYSVLEGARVADRGSVGPFARLRPGAELGEGARVGNFVEVKKATLGAGAKANHLAYLGDASIGAGSNIGAGVVTCNYDGEKKHRTEIGADAFVGSDTMLVAPVKVGDRALTGAGSVITQDVPDDSLALGRARQRNLIGWRKKRPPAGG